MPEARARRPRAASRRRGAGPTGPLQRIPGVGPSIERDLQDLGYTAVEDLRGADPEDMYESLCELRGERIDRCVLYVFRCAAHYAACPAPEPELLLWWNWKDPQPPRRRRCK